MIRVAKWHAGEDRSKVEQAKELAFETKAKSGFLTDGVSEVEADLQKTTGIPKKDFTYLAVSENVAFCMSRSAQSARVEKNEMANMALSLMGFKVTLYGDVFVALREAPAETARAAPLGADLGPEQKDGVVRALVQLDHEGREIVAGGSGGVKSEVKAVAAPVLAAEARRK